MYKSKEEIVEKMQQIARVMQQKVEKAEELKASALMDRGRLEELKNLHDMFEAVEAEEDDGPSEKPKNPTPRRAPKKKAVNK